MEKVSWSEFLSSVPKLLNSHRIEDRFTDVTLISDDNEQFKAHKLVLSSGSKFFDKILGDISHSHPVIFLDSVYSGDLNNVLEYIYNGEIMVQEADLHKFLKLATRLKCPGLSISKHEKEMEQSFKDQKESFQDEQDEKTSIDSHPKSDSQDNLTVKSESGSNESESDSFILSNSNIEDIISSFAMSTEEPRNTNNQGKFLLLEKRKDVNSSCIIPTDNNISSTNEAVCTMNGKSISRESLNKVLEIFIKPEPNDMFSCTQCPTQSSKKTNLQQHAEIHLNLQWKCDLCTHVLRTSATLRQHKRNSCKGLQNTEESNCTGAQKVQIKQTPIKNDPVAPFERELNLVYMERKFGNIMRSKPKRKKGPPNRTNDTKFCKIKGEMFAMSDLYKILEEYYQKVSAFNFKCLKCSKTTKMKSHMEEHAQIHVKNLEFKCDLCCQIVSTTNKMRQHKLSKKCKQLKLQTDQQRLLESAFSVFPKV